MYNKKHEKFFFLHDIMISSALFENYFSCSLQQCRGACCVQGDYGAPLSLEEAQELEAKKHHIGERVVDPAHQEVFLTQGPTNYYPELHQMGTTICGPEYGGNGACVFVRQSHGIAYCGLQEEHEEDASIPAKPVSCHLYPVRVRKNPENKMTYLEYDQWDICAAACRNGQRSQIPLFAFVKTGLVRAFGMEFYNQMEEIYRDNYQFHA